MKGNTTKSVKSPVLFITDSGSIVATRDQGKANRKI
jgi:hypothetical protein